MRSSLECIAKAVEMDVLAAASGPAAAQYVRMALRWRQLAKQAAWQDSLPRLHDSEH
jgi:hypothetical protein